MSKHDRLLRELASEPRGGDVAEAVAWALSEIARLRALTEWQDISTAPRDGTRILVFGKPDDHPEGMVTYHRPGIYTANWEELDGAFCLAGAPWDGPFIEATDWMPAPTPPDDA